MFFSLTSLVLRDIHLTDVKEKKYISMLCLSQNEFGNRGVMAWGCFSLEACSDLVKIQEGINDDSYIRKCLEEYVVPSKLLTG